MYTLNAEAEWFVWYSRQISVRDFYYLLHFSAYVHREREREKGNEANWLPKIQDVANNVCSPFQRQGAYTRIGYS